MQNKPFKISKKKLLTLWNEIANHESRLQSPDNFNTFLQTNQLNTPIIKIYESEWKNIALQFPTGPGVRTDVLGEEVGFGFNYDFVVDELDLPESLIPFLNINVIAKTIPESRFLPLNEWKNSLYVINHKITVNTAQIYNGISFSQTKRLLKIQFCWK